MQPIVFKLEVLRGVPGEIEGIGATLPVEKRAVILQFLLDTLGNVNDKWLAEHKAKPLYKSGVRYRMEPGTEAWLDIPTAQRELVADCEDLASWRASELRAAGIDAKALVKWNIRPNGSTLYHIVVGRNDVTSNLPPDHTNNRFLRRNDGEIASPYQWIEDPSAVLGM